MPFRSAHFDDESPGWGGAREGAGRKPAGYTPPQERVDLDRHKARHEAAKADLAELTLRERRSAVVDRAAVRTACASAELAFAQTMRAIPDSLERRFGLPPEQVERLASEIDAALGALSQRMAEIYANAQAEERTAEDAIDIL